jgi:hypothetical protein
MNEYVKNLEQSVDELQKKLAEFESAGLLRIPTLSHDDYVDKDYIMLHAVFAILVHFVEDECGGKLKFYLDEDLNNMFTNEEERKTLVQSNEDNKKLYDLYLWWKNEYPKLEKDPTWHIKGYDEETAKMNEVINLRKYLWT